MKWFLPGSKTHLVKLNVRVVLPNAFLQFQVVDLPAAKQWLREECTHLTEGAPIKQAPATRGAPGTGACSPRPRSPGGSHRTQSVRCFRGRAKHPPFGWLLWLPPPARQHISVCVSLLFFLPHRLLLYIICQYWVSFHFTFLPLNASSSSQIFPPFTAAFFRWFGLSQAGTAGVVSKSRNVVMSIYCEAQFIAASFFG